MIFIFFFSDYNPKGGQRPVITHPCMQGHKVKGSHLDMLATQATLRQAQCTAR